jgi:predicted CoA-binding protein
MTARSVAIVGASPDPAKYSFMAVQRFRARGWTVWPVHPSAPAVDGVAAFRDLAALPGRPDLVCLYVNPRIGLGLLDAIAALHPLALWLNPGADGPELVAAAQARGLRTVEACVLVALGQGDPLALAGIAPLTS